MTSVDKLTALLQVTALFSQFSQVILVDLSVLLIVPGAKMCEPHVIHSLVFQDWKLSARVNPGAVGCFLRLFFLRQATMTSGGSEKKTRPLCMELKQEIWQPLRVFFFLSWSQRADGSTIGHIM